MCEEGGGGLKGLIIGGTFRHLTTIHSTEPRWDRLSQARPQEAADTHWERNLQPSDPTQMTLISQTHTLVFCSFC